MNVCRDGGFRGVSGGSDGSSGGIHLAQPTLRSSMTTHSVHCVSQASRRSVDRTPSMGVKAGLDWGQSGGRKCIREVRVDLDCHKFSKLNLSSQWPNPNPKSNCIRWKLEQLGAIRTSLALPFSGTGLTESPQRDSYGGSGRLRFIG